MAVEVLWDAYLSLNAVDVSAQISSVTLSLSTAELDTALMGEATVLNEPGLKSFSLEVDFKNEYSDDGLDEDLFALWDARTKFAVALRKSQTDAISTSNPEYQFTGFIASYPPIAGAKGTLSSGSMRIANSSTLVRDVTP